MKHHEQLPLTPITKGRGVWLFDAEGKRYLDAVSSWWVNLFGHANTRINQAIKNQVDELEHVMLAGFTHEPVVCLSEQLLALAPKNAQGQPFSHCLYASDGASATEIALKLAVHYWRNTGNANKTNFIHLTNSYHGETLGALAVTDIPVFRTAYAALIAQSFAVPCPDPRQKPQHLGTEEWVDHCIEKLRTHLEHYADKTAAMIIEPLVQGAAGMVMYSPRYLKTARELCALYNVLFIADEIAVGMGRTGKLFACEHSEIQPDMLLLSKGLTGGYLPLSVVLTTQSLYDAFYDNGIERAFLHSHSYTGNPLACRAALEVLAIFKDDDTIEHNQARQPQWQDLLAPLKQHPNITHWRQCGMILAFDVITQDKQFAQTFFEIARQHQLLLRPIGNTVYFIPPYIINDEEMTFLVDRTMMCLDHVSHSLNRSI